MEDDIRECGRVPIARTSRNTRSGRDYVQTSNVHRAVDKRWKTDFVLADTYWSNAPRCRSIRGRSRFVPAIFRNGEIEKRRTSLWHRATRRELTEMRHTVKDDRLETYCSHVRNVSRGNTVNKLSIYHGLFSGITYIFDHVRHHRDNWTPKHSNVIGSQVPPIAHRIRIKLTLTDAENSKRDGQLHRYINTIKKIIAAKVSRWSNRL